MKFLLVTITLTVWSLIISQMTHNPWTILSPYWGAALFSLIWFLFPIIKSIVLAVFWQTITWVALGVYHLVGFVGRMLGQEVD